MRSSEFVFEKWSQKYKSSINCSHPKGFSQKAHCAGKNKQNESIEMEMVCETCGMCETHGSLNEIAKGQKDSNGYTKCWSGYHAQGTKKSATTGKQVRNCVPNESVDEDITRRGFLKGVGAAAVAGAAGGTATKANAQQVSQWVKYATDLATKSMGRIHQDTGYDLRNWLVVNVSNWVTDYCTKTNSYNAKEVIDYCNQQGLEASGLDKQHALVTAFLTNMKNRYQDFLSAYRAGINESFQKFNAAVQSQEKEKNVMGNLSREEFDVLLDALIIYAICKDRQLDNSELFRAVAASIKRFIDANNAKDYVNSIYPKARQSVEVLKNNPDIYQKESSQFFKNAGNTIAKLDNISSNKKPEFESVNQGVAEDLTEEFDLIESIIEGIAEQNDVDAEAVWADLESLTEDELYAFAVTSQLNEDWQKANKRDKTDGMSQKAVNAYRRENPGSKLKTAVTTKPGKLKKGGKASKRRKSYCSRSRGQMKMHSISCAKTPDKAICKARRRWNC